MFSFFFFLKFEFQYVSFPVNYVVCLLVIAFVNMFSLSGSTAGNAPTFNIPSAASTRKTDDFLNSDNDKNDYDW